MERFKDLTTAYLQHFDLDSEWGDTAVYCPNLIGLRAFELFIRQGDVGSYKSHKADFRTITTRVHPLPRATPAEIADIRRQILMSPPSINWHWPEAAQLYSDLGWCSKQSDPVAPNPIVINIRLVGACHRANTPKKQLAIAFALFETLLRELGTINDENASSNCFLQY